VELVSSWAASSECRLWKKLYHMWIDSHKRAHIRMITSTRMLGADSSSAHQHRS
jgi:hypothetical protein